MADIIGIAIPESIEGLELPEPNLLNFYNLRQQRTFFIDYEIDEHYALIDLAKEIIRINNDEVHDKDPEPIKLFIHSYGGDLRQALFFCDLIQASHVPVITIATGAAMSAGFLIFISGKRRYAFKHTKLLVHQGSGTISGNYDEMDAAQKAYKKEITSMKEYILSHTNIYEKTFEKHKKSDWYLTGEELITYGVADKIITDYSEIK